MRKLMVLLTVFLLAGIATADVYVAWSAQGGFYWQSDENTGLLDTTGGTTLAQLVWSPDDQVSDANFAVTDYVTDGEVVLANYTVQDGVAPVSNDGYGWWATDIVVNDGGANPDGGFIYARLFQDADVNNGDWYYAGPVISAVDADFTGETPPTPQSYNMNRGSLGDPVDGPNGAQVVPEPSTFALFGLGAIIVGLRRRKK